MAHFIAQNHDGTPRYFSPKEGSRFGVPGGGWVDDFTKALGFARATDAQTYLEFHLPHMQPVCVVIEKDLPGPA